MKQTTQFIKLTVLMAAMACWGCAARDNPAFDPHAGLYTSHIASTLPTSSTEPTTSPVVDGASDDESQEWAWKTISSILHRDGVRKDAVLAITVPRDDLYVAIDGMDVPTAGGVESVFNFWHCSCGKTSMMGQFCVMDYELNDVIDALRAGHMEIAGITPMVLHSRISPLILRFQGEGKAPDMAKTIKEALSWMGKERNAPAESPSTK